MKLEKKNIKIIPAQHENYGDKSAIDTTFLYEDFHNQYIKSEMEIEVDFRKVVNWLKTGDQNTHQIHSYPGKLLPHIAHFFLNSSKLGRPGSLVLDPFCGSGTVALEASIASKTCYFADSNPLASLITKVKTTPYDPKILRAITLDLVRSATRYKSAPQIKVINQELWYSQGRKIKLEKILRAINNIEDISYIDFFKVCFSTLIRKLSNADPSISVPVRLKTKSSFSNEINRKIESRLSWVETCNPINEFYRICELNIYRVELTNLAYPARTSAIQVGSDAKALKNPFNKGGDDALANLLPLTITSPPYGSAQKYIRSSALSLNWLGLSSVDELRSFEAISIGREYISNKANNINPIELPTEFEDFLVRIKKVNSLRENITRAYLTELSLAFKEISRVTSLGGTAVIIVGNNQVCGETLKNDLFVSKCFQTNNMDLQMVLVDKIKSRGLMTKRNKTASVISGESVLVFTKAST